jgi:CRISPR-associated protein Cas2
MFVLVTYDVSTIEKAGQKRLQKVSKTCLNYGQRVQKSVFECIVTPEQFLQLRRELTSIIDLKTDSLRFYQLGREWHEKVEHVGANSKPDLDGPLII